eukprot:6164929-Amphidinium_carterae.1
MMEGRSPLQSTVRRVRRSSLLEPSARLPSSLGFSYVARVVVGAAVGPNHLQLFNPKPTFRRMWWR